MKTTFFAILIFISNSIFAQNTDIDARITTKPEQVTLYVSGAQVTAKGNTNLKSGRQTVVFDKLSNFINANSVQVKADKDITILSVNYQFNYLEPEEKKDFKQLEDSLKYYRQQIQRLSITKNSYIEEISLLQANKSIKGDNVGVTATELTKMADLIRTRYAEAALRKLEIEEKEMKLTARIVKMDNQLALLKQGEQTVTGEVVVQLIAATAGNANFELGYFVNNCSWSPLYDIRVKDVNTPTTVIAKANVIQNTGQDWKNVKLSLSTGNPTLGNTKPNLNPWTLSLSDPIVYRKARYKTQAPAAAYDKEEAPVSDALLSEVVISSRNNGYVATESITAAEITRVDNNQLTNAIFNISVPYNIASNGKENIVEIQQYEVAANYSYFSIPKIDNDAFLVADLIGWDKGELLSGDANVYFENNYVGTTYFDARIVDDTLSFALGRDNNITIKRKQTKDFNEKTSISGNTKKITRSFDIEVKNTRKSAIEIELEDQIPLSNNEELIIEAINTGNAEYNKETGKLTWKLKLNPAESKKLTFSYSVKFPKKMILNGLY
jgi:uncharacterized protein (TIGR02231 family)